MNTTEQYHRLGVPTTLLGWSQSSWRSSQIRIILDHYKWKYGAITPTKLNLMHELDLLVQERDLDFTDRMEILNADKRGGRLPKRKRRVRKVPHPTFPDWKAVARRELARNQAQTRPRTQPAVAASLAATPQAPNENLAYARPNVDSAVAGDCAVCFEILNPQNTPRRKITSSCNHEPDTCKSCLTTSISTKLDNKVWDQIDCPTCGQRLDYKDVKAFADPMVFGRYDNHSLQTCLSNSQFQHCRHPNCQSGQQYFPEEDSYMICVACGGRTCVTCNIIWHPSETCADIAARRAEEAAATQYLTTNVKLCPRCNIRGEKVSGCDHITCPQCRYQYCWVCLADYAEIRRLGNTAHRNNCRYHSRNLPTVPRMFAAARANTTVPAIAAPQAAAPLPGVAEDQAAQDPVVQDGDAEGQRRDDVTQIDVRVI